MTTEGLLLLLRMFSLSPLPLSHVHANSSTSTIVVPLPFCLSPSLPHSLSPLSPSLPLPPLSLLASPSSLSLLASPSVSLVGTNDDGLSPLTELTALYRGLPQQAAGNHQLPSQAVCDTIPEGDIGLSTEAANQSLSLLTPNILCLQAALPLLQQELLHCAQVSRQSPQQYLANNEKILFDAADCTDKDLLSPDKPADDLILPNKRRLSNSR